jgi:hypothetical protein
MCLGCFGKVSFGDVHNHVQPDSKDQRAGPS